MKILRSSRDTLYKAAFAFAVCSLFQSGAVAANKVWTPGTTDFNLGSNWAAAGTPGIGDVVQFTGAAGTQPTATATITVGSISFTTAASSGYLVDGAGFLTIGGVGASGSGNITSTNTTLNNTITNFALGNAGTHTVSQSNGGTLTLSNITGGGGILMAGGGTRILSGTNTFTGGVTLVTGSTAHLNSATAPGTGTLSIAGTLDNSSGSLVTLSNNNALIINGDTTFTGTNALNLGTGAGTLGAASGASRVLTVSASTLTIGGAIANGSTANSISKAGAGTLTLAGNNTFTGSLTLTGGNLNVNGSNAYTGATTISAGSFVLGGANGSILSTSGISVATGLTFTVDNTGAGNNVSNRLSDSTTTTLNGWNFLYKGSDQAATNSSETIGALSATLGTNVVTNTFGGTNSSDLTVAAFNHSTGQTAVLFNGTNLGQNSGTSSVAHTFLTSAPTLVGTTAASSSGINSSVKNTVIVPYLVGETTITSGGTGTATGTANTFLTYDSTTGLRPLNVADEFTQNSIVTGDNIRLTTGTTTAAATTSVNSLLLNAGTSTTLAIGAGQTLTNASGAILFTGNATISGATGTLAFGNKEAMITVNSGAAGTISTLVTTSGGGITKSGLGSLTMSGALNVGSGNLTLTNNNSGLLTVSGALTSTGATNLILNSNGTGTGGVTTGAVNVQGTITNSGLSSGATVVGGIVGNNVTGITQNSATSSLELSSLVNTFTGSVNVLSGNLNIKGDGSLGNLANTVTLNGATSILTAQTNPTLTNRSIILNGGGTFAGTMNASGNISGTGVLTSNGTSLLSGNNTMAGVTQGASGRFIISNDANIGGASSSITFANSATLFSILGTEFTSFGTHTVAFGSGNAGSLSFDVQDRNHSFTFDRVDTLNVNSATTLAALAKTGAGTLRMTVAQTYSNSSGVATGLYGGNFIIDSAAGGSLNSAGRLGFGGGTLTLLGKAGSGTATTQSTGDIFRVEAGGGTIVVDSNGGNNATTLNLGAIATTFNAGSSLNIRTVQTGSGVASATTTSTNTNGLIGAGRTIFNGSDFATNTTNLSGGTIGAAGTTTFVGTGAVSTTNYGLTGSDTVTASESMNTLKITSSGAGQSLNLGSQTLTLSTGGLLYTGANDYTIASASGTLKSNTTTNSDLIIHQYGSGNLTIDSLIANGIGVSTLTKTGSGKLTLTATNTYTGATYINGGLISVGASTQLGSAGLSLNGGGLQVTTGFSTSRTVALGGNGGTFDVSDGQTLTLSGVISTTAVSNGVTTGSLTLNDSGAGGSGLLILSGTNTFAGGVEITKGVLQQGSAGAINTGGLNTLTFGAGSTATFRMNGFGATVAGLNGSNTSALIENASNTASNFTVNNGGANSYAGNIQNGTGTGALSFIKGGAGDLTLSGTNTYTGGTTVNNGALIGTTNSLQGNIVNNAAVRFSQSTAGTYAGNLTGTGALTKAGTGDVTVSGSNSYSGITTVSNGTLLVSGTHSGAGAYSVLSGGTLGGIGSITTASNAGVTLASGAKLAPGSSPGTLTLALGTGVLDLSAAVGGGNAGALVFELGINGSGTSDILALTSGVLNIGSGVLEFSDFNFTALSGFAAGTYTLFDTNSTITGALGSTLTGTVGGFNGTLSFANSNQDLVLTVAAVPEPATYVMLVGGLAVLGLLRRRKKV